MKAILFDLDGVVLDSMPAHTASWRLALAEAGLELDERSLLLHEGNLDFRLLTETLLPPGHGLTPEGFDRIMARQRSIYLENHADRVAVYPRADSLLTDLSRRGLILALVTSSTREVLLPGLREWLDQRFSLVVTGDMAPRSKPFPDPYLIALSRLGVNADQALVVENAPAGIEAAKAAGLTCVALATTLSPDNLGRADVVLPDHEALAAWLETEDGRQRLEGVGRRGEAN